MTDALLVDTGRWQATIGNLDTDIELVTAALAGRDVIDSSQGARKRVAAVG
jgi:hypothetical protein